MGNPFEERMTTQRKWWVAAALVCLAVGSVATAKMIAPPPLPLRLAGAEVAVVGKVTGFGPKLVPGEMFKGDVRQMQIATVKVSETLLGKGLKEIKVGFFPPATGPGGGTRPGRGRFGVNLVKDEESALLLVKHPTKKDLYVVGGIFDVVPKTGNAEFAAQLKELKSAGKLLAHPEKGLKSKDAEQRYLTAAMLITRYRTVRAGNDKTEEAPATQSKLILTALADADWDNRNPRHFRMNPQGLFAQLGLTDKDGWKQPEDFRLFAGEAKKWLKDNAGKYRIRRYVGTGVGTAPDPEP
jgi:hypothetical protein